MNNRMEKAVVLGATGGMGSALVRELVSRGVPTVAFSRSADKLKRLAAELGHPAGLEIRAGDAFRPDEVADASRGAEVLFYSLSIPYPEWYDRLLPLVSSVLETARRVGARVVDIDNIYPYGRSRMPRATEEHPLQPHTRKGRIRLEMERLIREAERSGTKTAIVRFPDFYGPDAPNTLLGVTLEVIALGRVGFFIGDLDVPREYLYLPDGAKAAVGIALRRDAYGETWHMPGAGVITGRDVVRIAREAAGVRKPVFALGLKSFALMGVFSPLMREMREMLHLTEEPFVLSGEKYASRIGPVTATPYEQGIRQTVRALKERHARRG